MTEARDVVADIQSQLQSPGHEARDFAILFRTNEQPRAFEMELRRVKLPYVLVGGMSFYDRKEVRDVLAYLESAGQPRGRSFAAAVINVPARGVGQATVQQLLRKAVSEGEPLWSVLEKAVSIEGVSSAAADGDRQVSGTGQALCKPAGKTTRLSTWLRDWCARSAIRTNSHGCTRSRPNSNRAGRRGRSDQRVGRLRKAGRKPSLSGFLDEIAVGDRDTDRDKESQLSRNAIVLMTLHSAKGLEFPHVYMVGMEEGLLPHHRAVAAEGDAIEEERRLCYVGITRAQDRLTLSLALTRMKWGKAAADSAQPLSFRSVGPGRQSQRRPTPRAATSRRQIELAK